jgi:clan AA aspartic protease (TIGR02281 family)
LVIAMFLLGFEGLVIANLVALAAAKASSDAIIAEGGNDPQPRGTSLPHGYQPHYAAQSASYDPREVRLDASPSGHFYANVSIDGCHAMMMIDTGATGVVVGHKLARQLGFDLRNASYDTPVKTGGGKVWACRFTIPHMTVEGLEGRNIDAIVHQNETATDEICGGLIGQSFLRQLAVNIRGDTMILRP